MTGDGDGKDKGSSKENKAERLDRELIELLNGLRVALPGVQVLFAFLLMVPFNQRFTQVSAFQRDVYFATLIATAISAVLLIAPSAHHRLEFRQGDKERIMTTSNVLAIAGLGFLALAMTGAVLLITAFLFSPAMTAAMTAATALLFGLVWVAIPLKRRLDRRRPTS